VPWSAIPTTAGVFISSSCINYSYLSGQGELWNTND
jgi:hypothetical protein